MGNLKPNELKILNLVDVWKGDIHYGTPYVQSISSRGINEGLPGEYEAVFDNPINDELLIRPIPLTEEWLLKFGITGFEIKRQAMGFNISFRIGNAIHEYFVLKIPEFIHSFQNLFFALAGKELIFSLPKITS